MHSQRFLLHETYLFLFGNAFKELPISLLKLNFFTQAKSPPGAANVGGGGYKKGQ